MQRQRSKKEEKWKGKSSWMRGEAVDEAAEDSMPLQVCGSAVVKTPTEPGSMQEPSAVKSEVSSEDGRAWQSIDNSLPRKQL